MRPNVLKTNNISSPAKIRHFEQQAQLMKWAAAAFALRLLFI